MQYLEVCGAVRPLKWSLGVKWLNNYQTKLLLLQKQGLSNGWAFSQPNSRDVPTAHRAPTHGTIINKTQNHQLFPLCR